MALHGGGRKVAATTAVVVVVVVWCVAAVSGQESAGGGVGVTTLGNAEVTTQLVSRENDTFIDKTTITPDGEEDTNEEATKASLITTTTTKTTTTTNITTTTADEKNTTGAPSALNITQAGANATVQATPTPTARYTEAPQHNATTAATPCGMNADLKDGRCVCRPFWTQDPTSPGSPCTCPDLCQIQGRVVCPPMGTCRQITCNLATCTCPDHLVYSASTSSCVSVCQLYGDTVCGLGSGWRCVEQDEGRNFTCQCAEGYKMLEGVCEDIDECASGGVSLCDLNEHCVNSNGSYTCACQEGFLRAANGSCVNINECLNPRLHQCDQLCHDVQPPIRYTCGCYRGHTWNVTIQRCVLDNPETSCACGPPERSVCVQAVGGEKECYARPGYRWNDTAFIDASECGEPSSEQAWCWARGRCVEGVGRSDCVCAEGFTNDPPHTTDCVRVTCPEGTRLAGSECVDPCSSVVCPEPLTCRPQGAAGPSCRCLGRCLGLLQPDSNFSVYHGSFLVLSTPSDRNTAHRVVRAVEDYFGVDSVEVVSVTRSNSTDPTTSNQTNLSIEFTLMVRQPNIAHELPEVIKILCREVDGHRSVCVLPNGLQVVKDSIIFMDKDPCSDDPCPSERSFACSIKANVTGRFLCTCAPGFYKVNVNSSMGYCQDVNECDTEEHSCSDHQDCINTVGGFTCRSKLTSLGQNPETVQEMAIAFGVLFFVTLLALIAVLFLLKKKHKATRELVPMTTGFDNSTFK